MGMVQFQVSVSVLRTSEASLRGLAHSLSRRNWEKNIKKRH